MSRRHSVLYSRPILPPFTLATALRFPRARHLARARDRQAVIRRASSLDHSHHAPGHHLLPISPPLPLHFMYCHEAAARRRPWVGWSFPRGRVLVFRWLGAKSGRPRRRHIITAQWGKRRDGAPWAVFLAWPLFIHVVNGRCIAAPPFQPGCRSGCLPAIGMGKRICRRADFTRPVAMFQAVTSTPAPHILFGEIERKKMALVVWLLHDEVMALPSAHMAARILPRPQRGPRGRHQPCPA